MVGTSEHQNAQIVATLGTFLVGTLHSDFSNKFAWSFQAPGQLLQTEQLHFYLFYIEILDKYLLGKML